MKRKQYTLFFANLFKVWFQHFPESVALFGENTSGPLSEAQQAQLAAAVNEHKEKLKNRFKNYLGSTKAGRQSRAGAQSVFKTVLASIAEGEKCERNLQEIEAYSKLFYDIQLKDAIAQRLGVASSKLGKQSIQKIKEEMRALYIAEPEDVKQQVRDFIMTAKGEKGKGNKSCASPTDQIDPYRNIKMLAAIVNQFLTGLNKSTGWAFSLLAGGPSLDVQMNIDCYSFHVGLTSLGNDFSRAYPEFEGNIMTLFRDFLYRVYPSTMHGQKGDEVGHSPPVEGNASLASSGPGTSTGADHSGDSWGPMEGVYSVQGLENVPGGSQTDDVSWGSVRRKEQGESHEALVEAPESRACTAPDTPNVDYSLGQMLWNDSAPLNGSQFWMSSDFDQYLQDLSSGQSISVGDPDLPHLPPPPIPSPAPSPTHSHLTVATTTTPVRTRYLLNGSDLGHFSRSSPSPADLVPMATTLVTDPAAGSHHLVLPPAPIAPCAPVLPMSMSTGQSICPPNTTMTPPVVSGHAPPAVPSTVAGLDSNNNQSSELPSAEEEHDVRRSRSGHIITPATRNAIADSIGMENMQPKLGKRPRHDDTLAGRVGWSHR
ncbi:hypothetical protein JVT61DRAFT_6155 [Boletus reticuloceps]|uniref:Uncharacterized protein n=1 Tax=Boletus reticuloceps TaxID=495285 RepID=A0A8I2YKS9_9AGAM|nr:hypothetical protein JVT61DRAFT_6155 [Boletus reticuloceps]